MKILGKNRVEVNIGGETKVIVFTLGKDLKVTEILGSYLTEVSELTRETDLDVDTLKNLIGDVEGKEVSDASLNAAKKLFSSLDVSANNPLRTVSEVSNKMQNARVQVCSVLLTKFDDKGEPVEVITPVELLNGEKYSDEISIDEMMSLYGFAYNRFYDTLDEQEEKIKKLQAKKGNK